MRFTAKQYAQALSESLENTNPADTDRILDNFAKVLAENNDLRLFDEIASEYERLQLERKGVKTAEVISAHPLSEENEHAIIEQLNKLVKHDVKLKKQIDEGIIGGVIVKVDDIIIDASIKNSLNKLRNTLSE